MADSFFGFNTSLPSFLDQQSALFEDNEDEYDALNEETFGSKATEEGDWEENHEQFSKLSEQLRQRGNSFDGNISEDSDGNVFDSEHGVDGLTLGEGKGNRNDQLGEDTEDDVCDYRVYGSNNESSADTCLSSFENDIMTWRNKAILQNNTPVSSYLGKKVCTVEELERDLLSQSLKKHKAVLVEDIEKNLTKHSTVPPIAPVNIGIPRGHPPFPIRPNGIITAPTPFPVQSQLNTCLPCGVTLTAPFSQVRLPLINQATGPRPISKQPLFVGAPVVHFPPPALPFQGQSPIHANIKSPLRSPPGFHTENILQEKTQKYHNNVSYRPVLQTPPQKVVEQQNRSLSCESLSAEDINNRICQRFGRYFQRVEEVDEYAGLMTTKDKFWLDHIQYLQLSTTRPFVEDFYYAVMRARQAELDGTSNSKRDRREGSKDREQQGTPKIYSPAQFENSLGKLQIGSVIAPRKVIDVDVVSLDSTDSILMKSDVLSSKGVVLPVKEVLPKSRRDDRKHVQTLLEIEKLYVLLLQLEDTVSHIAELREAVTEPRNTLLFKMLNFLLSEDWLVCILCFRKGKMLLFRLLKLLSPKELDRSLCAIWIRVLLGLYTIQKQGQSGNPDELLRLYIPFKNWLFNAPFSSLLNLTNSLPSPLSEDRNKLFIVLYNKFGISALSAMIFRAHEIYSEAEEKQKQEWKLFLRRLTVAIGACIQDRVKTPISVIDVNIMRNHVKECFGVDQAEKFVNLEKIFSVPEKKET